LGIPIVLTIPVSSFRMTVLREKAAASRLGVAEENPPSSRSTTPDYTHPRSAPAMPVRGPSRLSSGAVSLPLPCTSIYEDGPFLLAMSTSLPVSPMSSNSSSGSSRSRSRSGSGPSSGMLMDLGDFHLGSPVSPLTPRGSPRSVRSRMLA